MKRSDISEMPEYFDRYINLVADVELSEAFEKSLEQIENLDRNTLEKLGSQIYAPDKWTAREIFQHIIDWERILASRTLLFARREGSVPQGIDENLLAANMNAERRTFDDLIEELKITRSATRAMFASFDDEMLLSTGTNWKYEVSVLAMGLMMIGHQIHHLKVLEEKYFPLLEQSESPAAAGGFSS